MINMALIEIKVGLNLNYTDVNIAASACFIGKTNQIFTAQWHI